MARRRARGRRLPRRRRKPRRDMTKGQILRPRRTPPEFVQVPKNQITVTFRYKQTSASVVKNISIGDIAANVVAQLGIGADSILNLQIISVSAWEMSGLQLVLGAFDLLEPGSEELQIVEDQPGRNQWATVGYRWPRAHQQVVFKSDDDKARLILYIAGPSDNVTTNFFVRLRVLWRGGSRISPRLARAGNSSSEAMMQ